MKKVLVLLVALFLFIIYVRRILWGVEITWECIKDPTDPNVGQYIFKMKLYRDCDGTTLSTFPQTLEVWNHPSVTAITLDWILKCGHISRL